MTLAVVLAKSPPAPIVTIGKFLDNLENLIIEEEKVQISERGKVIATWKHDRPTFFGGRFRGTYRVGLSIHQTGSALGKKKWYWVGRGTAVRYAVMTDDFEAKTEVGVIGSRPGQGGFSHLDTRDPKPGIQAREWDKVIAEDRTPIVRKGIDEAWLKTLSS